MWDISGGALNEHTIGVWFEFFDTIIEQMFSSFSSLDLICIKMLEFYPLLCECISIQKQMSYLKVH